MTALRSAWILTLACTVLVGFMGQSASASVLYDWVCDFPGCNGDSAFSSTIEISDAAFLAGDFTGVSGNVLSWTTTSGIGDGFTLALGDILTGPPGSSTDDDDNLRIVLNGTGLEISDLLDISAGTNITFFDSSIGRVDFFEGLNGAYSVGSLNDFSPVTVPSTIVIQGLFVRRVPEPATLSLIGIALAGLQLARRRRSSGRQAA